MPLLQYQCTSCGNKFEELVKNGDPLPRCPKCGGESKRDWQGKVYTDVKPSHCTHHCATCSGCK